MHALPSKIPPRSEEPVNNVPPRSAYARKPVFGLFVQQRRNHIVLFIRCLKSVENQSYFKRRSKIYGWRCLIVSRGLGGAERHLPSARFAPEQKEGGDVHGAGCGLVGRAVA